MARPSRKTQGAAAAPRKPRVHAPLPRQSGGAHEVKAKRPWRLRKHKKLLDE